MKIKDIFKKYEFLSSDKNGGDYWECHGLYILTHDACTKIGEVEDIELVKLDPIYVSETSVRFLVTMKDNKSGKEITSTGEADVKNCTSKYIGCIAEKRGIDRCILKLVNAYEYGAYSEVEEEEFERKANQGSPPKPQRKIKPIPESENPITGESSTIAEKVEEIVKKATSGGEVAVLDFGKYKGTKITEIDNNYLEYMAGKKDKSMDWKPKEKCDKWIEEANWEIVRREEEAFEKSEARA